MNPRVGTYTVENLAPGSFNVLLNDVPVAVLTRSNIESFENEWRIDLLTENSSSNFPLPFKARSHTFSSYRAATDWLGVREKFVVWRPVPASGSRRAAPRYRIYPSLSERYRLRLLAERSRFYGKPTGLSRLIGRGFIATTGQTDDEGRAEWVITDAGRAALAELEQ